MFSKMTDKKPRVSRKGLRVKGHNYERDTIKEFCDNLGLVYGKDLKRRPSREDGNDCMHLSRRSFDEFPFSVECKDRRTWSLTSWWKKLIGENTEDWQIPIVCARHYGTKEDFVLIRRRDFAIILGILKAVGGMSLLLKAIAKKDVDNDG